MNDLGELLRATREEKNLTIAQVSRATRIKPQFLEALEQGDYHLLPGAAYITGFLRNYAAHIGLHPDDVVQEYYAERPSPAPSVKAATRVLENGHNRDHRRRLFWSLITVFVLLGGGFVIRQYNDTYAHPYSPPNITPPNLGSPSMANSPAPASPHRSSSMVHVDLRSVRTVWVKVTVDGHAAFQGLLRPRQPRTWIGRSSVYVATMHGSRVRALVNGHATGPMSQKSGLVVDEATASGWQRVA